MATDKKGPEKVEGGIPDIEVLMKGLMSQQGVEGFLVFNDDGIPIKWTNSGFIKPGTPNSPNPIPPSITHHTSLAHDLVTKAKTSCRKILGEEGDLHVMRLHTSTREYIIAPAQAETLMVVQKSHSAALEPLVNIADREQQAQLLGAAGAKGKDGKDAKKK